MRSLAVSLSVIVVLMLGCAQLGLQPAQTFDQKLAYAYGIHTAVLDTASGELSTRQLTAKDGDNILRLADQARTLLDSAKVLSVTDVASATGKLTLATSILTELQTYLRSKGK